MKASDRSTASPRTILIVDDDPDVRSVLEQLLSPHFELLGAHDAASALMLARKHQPGVALLDLHLGDGPDGFWLLDRLKALDPALPVVILSVDRDTETIVRAMKAGAAHYIGKTPRYDELLERLRLAFDERGRAMQLEAHRLPETAEILGDSLGMIEVRRLLKLAAGSELPLVVLGETGTGKGLVARATHLASARRSGPFRDVNVGGLPSSVLDSELFGHERGAFTGAERLRRGLFELAASGTILLDEIGDLPRDSQVKLLKVVEEGRVHRLGSDDDVQTDVRVIAATHRDLNTMIAQGAFRADLFHRLAGLVIEIPPLRSRREDIPTLTRHFVGDEWEIAPTAIDKLMTHDWPGNVRELMHVMRRATLFAHDRIIGGEQIALHETGKHSDASAERAVYALPYHDASKQALDQFRRRYVESLLERCGGNVSMAARESGISRAHLHAMIAELGLKSRDGDLE
ncbi:MAG: sigma-54 dependent transcriptional regulator [Acidobacteriota bacterium]